MKHVGRIISVALVCGTAGFVGGAWFVTSGMAFQWIRAPKLPTEERGPRPPRVVVKRPHVKAVEVPTWAAVSGGGGGLGPRADRTDLVPSPGCNWAIEPRGFRIPGSWNWNDKERGLAGYAAVDQKSGRLRYLFIQAAHTGPALPLRPVFFDAQGNRHVGRGGTYARHSGSGGLFHMSEFFIDPQVPLLPSEIAYFGIERVVPDAAKRLVAAAQQEAKEKQMAILPPLELGQPYELDLPTVDGDRVRSADLRGKNVLVLIWGPDTSGFAMLAVKNIRKDTSKEALAVVNISFDGSVQDAREALAKEGGEGPLVVVPNDPISRRIWREGGGITALPGFYLLDREGILRFTAGSFDVRERVDTLMGRPSKYGVRRHAVFHSSLPARTVRIPPPAGFGQPPARATAPPHPPGP